MKFDDALFRIGEFGRYQRRLYFLLCLTGINTGIFMQISVFLLGVPKHRCALPGWDNDTYEPQSRLHLEFINRTIPPSLDKDLTYDPCHVYQSNVSYDVYNRPVNGSLLSCDQWVYAGDIFKSTLTSEQNLVCEKKFLPSLAKMFFFGGVLIGSFGFGVLSDTVGRKKTLMLSFVLVITFSISLVWSDSLAMFVVLRFLLGAANAGIFMTGFVIGMELVGPSKRMWAGIVVDFFTPTGLVILAGVAYAIRHWRYIELAVSLPMILYLSYFWLIPESPRWLISQNRYEEAEAILRHAASVNKATLPARIFDRDDSKNSSPKAMIWNLFASKEMATRTLIIFLNWTVVSMVYYGLALNTGNLGENYYLNFLLAGLVEFPAYILCLLLLNRIGRKWLHCVGMVGGGVACISTAFATVYGGSARHALTVTLAMVGKLGATAAYGVLYVFSAELYPTVVRNAGMGISSCCARVGGILAPYIAGWTDVISGDLGKDFPLVIFGIASVIAGLLALKLPETLNRQLPETIEDAKDFGKSPQARFTDVHVNRGFQIESASDDDDDDDDDISADVTEAVPLM